MSVAASAPAGGGAGRGSLGGLLPFKHMVTVLGDDGCKNTVAEKKMLATKKADWGYVDCQKKSNAATCARFGATLVHPVTVVVGWDPGMFAGLANKGKGPPVHGQVAKKGH
eukprot:Hpha_TRINITY_DN16853_c3_g3::TRINITY_DN16853_c3_g3_i1::g.150492::m.150492